jgi:hypothetical protein
MIQASAIPVRLAPPTARGRLRTYRSNGLTAASEFANGAEFGFTLANEVDIDLLADGTLVAVTLLQARPKHFKSSDAVPAWPHNAREADLILPCIREIDEDIEPALLASPGKERLLVQFGESLEAADPIKLSNTCIAYVDRGLLRGFLTRYDR